MGIAAVAAPEGERMIAKKITRTLTLVVVLFLIICCTAFGFYFGFSYVLSQNARFSKLDAQYGTGASASPINEDTPGAIELIIPRASSTKEIAELLKSKGIIENTFVFSLLSKFNGFDGNYMAGTHFIKANMSYDELMYILSQKPQAVRVTFQEGLTYREVKQKLKTAGVNFDEKVLDSMVKNPQIFLDYKFVTGIAKSETRDWLLQGYLYPDTYEFDINTDEETILRTFLNNTERKLPDEYYERIKEPILGVQMTMDQIITLASIIQNECTLTEEMRRVSGVFYNRLRKSATGYFPLGSCATVNYLRKEMGLPVELWATEQSKTFNSPYNTYNVEGLPPGPICSPGDDAIRAALWPEKNKFLYFCAKGDGSNVFAETESQQNANIAKYRK
jgi:UPF0755 protein